MTYAEYLLSAPLSGNWGQKAVYLKEEQLKDLLIHEIDDLYSAEEQIISALPAMIEKAQGGCIITIGNSAFSYEA